MSLRLPVIVNNELRIDASRVDAPLVEDIKGDLLILTDEYRKAKKRRMYLGNIKQFHVLFKDEGDILVMPRGYALRLKQLAREHGLRVQWINRTVFVKGDEIGKPDFSFREHQRPAVRAMKRHRIGIYKAPTGSGKTASVCGCIWYTSPQRTLILVDRKNLIDQWIKAIRQHLDPDFDIGVIGDGEWNESRITIATIQTIHRNRAELAEEFWDEWDLVVLDECHHVTAEMYRSVVNRFNARLRMGVSATPDKTGEFELAQAILGPVFHEDDHVRLRRDGILIRPSVKVVYSDFKFNYWGDHKADKKGHCEVPKCPNPKPHHRHRNNYAQLKAALITDEQRNGMIREIVKGEGWDSHLTLIATDETKHIEAIYQSFFEDDWIPLDEIYVLTGQQTRRKREVIVDKLTRRGHGVLLSTIAQEAMDIPSIDRIVMGFPTRNNRKTEQIIGRGTRITTGKSDCLVWDIADDTPPTLGQLRSRMAGYQRMDLEVTVVNPPKRKKGLGRLAAVA